MYGVMGGNVEVTKFLTMSGADLTITDNVSRDQRPTLVHLFQPG